MRRAFVPDSLFVARPSTVFPTKGRSGRHPSGIVTSSEGNDFLTAIPLLPSSKAWRPEAWPPRRKRQTPASRTPIDAPLDRPIRSGGSTHMRRIEHAGTHARAAHAIEGSSQGPPRVMGHTAARGPITPSRGKPGEGGPDRPSGSRVDATCRADVVPPVVPASGLRGPPCVNRSGFWMGQVNRQSRVEVYTHTGDVPARAGNVSVSEHKHSGSRGLVFRSKLRTRPG
jgi:hypothetical protein